MKKKEEKMKEKKSRQPEEKMKEKKSRQPDEEEEYLAYLAALDADYTPYI